VNKIRVLLMLFAAVGASSIVPSHAAAGQAVCQIAAQVTINDSPGTGENLLAVDGGAGTLSGNMVCEGSIAGAALNMTGNFSFCKYVSPTVHGSQCTNQPPIGPEQPVFDAAGGATQSASGPVVTGIQGTVSFTLNTGTSCSMTLNGHSVLVAADVQLLNFSCNNGAITFSSSSRAIATAAIIVDPTLSCPAGPNGAKACFRQLAFVGSLQAF
jgi:hypothetical protein